MLSGLDRSTEEFIWTNVFGPRGIFRQHGITVILATHAGMFGLQHFAAYVKD